MTSGGCPFRSVPILRLERVGKRFGRRAALDGVDLEIADGAFILLVGANGSGKTTLLRLLASTSRPTSGRILRDGAPAPEEARRTTAYVGHQPLLYEELTAQENVVFVLRMHGVRDPEAVAARWIETFGLQDRADDRVATFSRGMRQRLALARSFALSPRLLLLDEPATALDAEAVDVLVAQLRAVRGAMTVVVAAHDADDFRPIASRTVELRAGRLVDVGGTP